MISKRIITAAALSLMLVGGLQAQKKAATPQKHWLDTALEAKEKVAGSAANGLPFVSGEFRRGTTPEKVSIDITGLKELVLVTWGTPDGNDFDHAVWAEAKLTKKDGSTVWLDEVKFKFKKVDGDWFRLNTNFSNLPFKIRDTFYKRGVLAHANSLLVVDLGGEYTKFESQIGIDEGSAGGSAVFKVLPTSGQAEAEALLKVAPEAATVLVPFLGVPLEDWLTTPGTTLEESAIKKIIKQITKPAYFNEQLATIAKLPNKAKQIEEYMKLAKQAQEVLDIQNQLAWLNTEAISLAMDDMKKAKGFDAAKYQPKYDELMAIAKNGFDGIYSLDKATVEAAAKALKLKREILLSNPALDMDKIIVTRYQLGSSARWSDAPSMGTQANNWSGQFSASRAGRKAEIIELSNLRGDKVKERVIYKPTMKNGPVVTDVHLHWDADRMMFTSIDTNKRLQVFQVGLDGKNFEQITNINEPDLEFCDGIYLPSGKVLVNTNIGFHGVPCVDGDDAVGNIALYDPKTGELRRLTFDQDNNWNPTVLENGRVMYTRWEYTDLMHYYSRIVFHMNPDGTEQKALYGSGGYFPNSTFDMEQIPGSSAFISIASGHHGVARSGRLIIFDPAKGRKEEKGVVQEIPFRNRPVVPIVKDEMVNGVWPQFIKPHPLNDKYFLVTAKLTPNSLWGIYLVDLFDNVTLIAEAEGEGMINPIPVVKRSIPPVIPERIQPGNKEATVFIQDLYEGEGLMGVPRGTVKKLRVLAYEYAYIKSSSNHFAQGIQSGWDIKRLLGEVPVEADGSAIFTIPANTPVALQPLDSLGRAVQWMRSWFVGMPGETVSCIGCHEDQGKIPVPKRVLASQKQPVKIQAPEGGVRPFTFELEIQPILDRACVACHNGSSAIADFTGGRMDDKVGFSKSYLAFHPYFYRQGSEAEMYVLNPYEYSESASEMMQMLKAGHHGVKLTEKEIKTLYNWVDFNVPYHSAFKANDYQATECSQKENQYNRRRELLQKYANVDTDWQKEISDYAAYLAAKPKAEPVKPVEAEVKEKAIKVKGWPFSAEQAKTMVTDGQNKMSVEVAPGVTMNFVRIPAGEYVMGKNSSGSAPVQKVKIAKAFWMGEMEVSNEQMRALLPEHNSRYIGQFWKDHTTPGYYVNQPENAAIRMTWEEAVKFCELMSQKTGKKVTLPTQEQWEWAARAGNDGDFWYGTTNTDFAPYENLADVQLTKMAVSGVDPVPMSKDNFWYPYLNYIPKVETVDDGNMLLTKGGSYKANPWGLYDIYGNVAEWTRSDYYPTADQNVAEKVVRGGSWYDRPKKATSSSMRSFLPWQKVWNVGFRVIIEE